MIYTKKKKKIYPKKEKLQVKKNDFFFYFIFQFKITLLCNTKRKKGFLDCLSVNNQYNFKNQVFFRQFFFFLFLFLFLFIYYLLLGTTGTLVISITKCTKKIFFFLFFFLKH
jgi:hypothetical protein